MNIIVLGVGLTDFIALNTHVLYLLVSNYQQLKIVK